MILSQFAARTGIFAEGRFLGRLLDNWALDSEEFARTKLPHLLVVLVVAFILWRIIRLATERITTAAERHAASPEHIQQAKTVAGAARATGLAILGLITGLHVLDLLGVNLAPLLASAGVAGIAIGLAAQNIVKDMLNGLLVLVENQFNVGDQVKIAGFAGTVEGITLRKTTLRDADGTLYVIPNSQITTVANQSLEYSVANVPISADYSAEPDKVRRALDVVLREIWNDAAMRHTLLAEPIIFGVDAIRGSELVYLVQFKTRPLQQFALLREFRRRVRLSFEENGILPGDPLRVYQPKSGD